VARAWAMRKTDETIYNEYKAEKPSSFLFFESAFGLDGTKLGAVQGKLGDARAIVKAGSVDPVLVKIEDKMTEKERTDAEKKNEGLKLIASSLEQAGVLKAGGSSDISLGLKALNDSELKVQQASIAGDRKTLQADSYIPGVMAVIYLLLLIYFKAIGGYRPLTIEEQK
jgi:hypothetical protein